MDMVNLCRLVLRILRKEFTYTMVLRTATKKDFAGHTLPIVYNITIDTLEDG